MSVDQLNVFLEEYWHRPQTALAGQVQSAAVNWQLKGSDPNSVALLDAATFPQFDPAPGLTTGSDQNSLTVRLPAQGSWSLQITGTLNGATGLPKTPGVDLSAINNVPICITLSDITLLAHITLDWQPDPKWPRITSISLQPSLAVDCDFLHIAVTDWNTITVPNRPPGRNAVKANFSANNPGKLFPGLASNGTNGSITIDLFATPWITLALDLLGSSHSFALAHGLPESLQILLQQVGAGDLPIHWGENPPTNQPLSPDAPEPATIAQWEAAADSVEAAVKTHLIGPAAAPPGVVFNKRFSGGAWTACDEGRDAAIWTGHLLAAEAFRYQYTTGAAQASALADLTTVLDGLDLLFQVPQIAIQNGGALCPNLGPIHRPPITGLVCRAVYPKGLTPTPTPAFDQPGVKVNNYYTDPVTLPAGTPGDVTAWLGFGRDGDAPSRDQLIGLICGLGWAGTFLPANSPVRQRIQSHIDSLLEYILVNDWGYPTPSGFLMPGRQTPCRYVTSFFTEFHQQLALLKIGATLIGVSPQSNRDYGALYNTASDALADWTWFPLWADTADPIAKYYKFNLDWNCLGILLYLETNAARRTPLLVAANLMRRATRHHRNPWFNLLWTLAQGQTPADWDTELANNDGFDGSETVAQETRTLLAQWLTRTKATTVPGGNPALPAQATPYKAWLTSKLGDPSEKGLLATFASLDPQTGTGLRATYALPAHVRPGADMDFIWQRDPFSPKLLDVGGVRVLDGGNEDPNLECPGIDFLLPFRVARLTQAIAAPRIMARLAPAAARPSPALSQYLALLDGLRAPINNLGLTTPFHDLTTFPNQRLAFLHIQQSQAASFMQTYFIGKGQHFDKSWLDDGNRTFLDLMDLVFTTPSSSLTAQLIQTTAVAQAADPQTQQAIQSLTGAQLSALSLNDLLPDPSAVVAILQADSRLARVSPLLPWVTTAFDDPRKTIAQINSLIWKRSCP